MKNKKNKKNTSRDKSALLRYFRRQNEIAHRRTLQFAKWGAFVALILIASMIIFSVTFLSKRMEMHFAAIFFSVFTSVVILLYVYIRSIYLKEEQNHKFCFMILNLSLISSDLSPEYLKGLYEQMSVRDNRISGILPGTPTRIRL